MSHQHLGWGGGFYIRTWVIGGHLRILPSMMLDRSMTVLKTFILFYFFRSMTFSSWFSTSKVIGLWVLYQCSISCIDPTVRREKIWEKKRHDIVFLLLKFCSVSKKVKGGYQPGHWSQKTFNESNVAQGAVLLFVLWGTQRWVYFSLQRTL